MSDFVYTESDDLLRIRPEALSGDFETVLQYAERESFSEGDIMIVEGTFDEALAFVGEGELEVFLPAQGKHDSITLHHVTSGMVIGEQSFFDCEPRSTSIRALTSGHWHRMSREQFASLFADHPALARDLLFELGRIVSLKLRETTRLLSESANVHTET
jgi:CRP-like cAMP-binding protein